MFNRSLWRSMRITGLVLREVVGWMLLVSGLNIFRICFRYLNQALVIEAFIAAIIGVMLFRGGLQLVKVAVAARAMRNAQALTTGEKVQNVRAA